MCIVLDITRSNYNKYRCSEDKDYYDYLIIKEIFDESKGTYGFRRVLEGVKIKYGVTFNHKKVSRIMKKYGLVPKYYKRPKNTVDNRRMEENVKDNLLKRNFSADDANQKWCTDVTYLIHNGQRAYLSSIIDLYDRKIIGWSLSDGMNTNETTLASWKMAIKNRNIETGLIFHSDRGVQYANNKFANVLESYKVTRSMSRKGNCWDNAVAESFFKSLKTELIYGNKLINKEQMKLQVFEYIEIWYNQKRRHSALNYMTINEFINQSNIYKNVA